MRCDFTDDDEDPVDDDPIDEDQVDVPPDKLVDKTVQAVVASEPKVREVIPRRIDREFRVAYAIAAVKNRLATTLPM